MLSFRNMNVTGRLISKECIDGALGMYLRIFIATEVGYGVDICKLTVFDKQTIEQLKSTSTGTNVCAEGYVSSKGYRNVLKIKVADISPCPTCLAPMDDSQDAQILCCGCFNDCKERIEGIWCVKATGLLSMISNTNGKKAVKLMLQQGENLLGYVTFPRTPFFDTLSILKEGDQISLKGWRDEKRHTKLTLATLHVTHSNNTLTDDEGVKLKESPRTTIDKEKQTKECRPRKAGKRKKIADDKPEAYHIKAAHPRI